MDLRTAIYRYCNYQERCHQEVKNKLYELGAHRDEVATLMAELIEAGLLNEERFARSYARGKFRMKGWGKNKIKYQLRALQVSDYCLKKGLSEIDPDEYYQCLKRLVAQKYAYYKAQKPEWARRQKVKQYLLGRGYEAGLIEEAVKDVLLTT